jgi:hypothetical protein
MENEFGLLSMIESITRSHKGLNSFIILGVWAIWTHHNMCVFYGVSPSLTGVVSLILEELRFWKFWPGLKDVLSPCPCATRYLMFCPKQIMLDYSKDTGKSIKKVVKQ